MDNVRIGFLHPGAMGISLAFSAKETGCTPCWVSAGRSRDTQSRAEKYGLKAFPSLEEFCKYCEIIVSVCPPHTALDIARQVADLRYTGIYADVNAVSPQHSLEVGKIVTAAGARYVDGGIIGLPAWNSNSTYLYLSGEDAQTVADCFRDGPLETEVIGDEPGRASALKMCFAANTKGTIALLCAVTAAAESLGVMEVLQRQWSRNGSDYYDEVVEKVRKVTAKAWRFSGEMEEISATFASAGLPGEFHLAARDIYDRLVLFKGEKELPPFNSVLDRLNEISGE